MRVLIDAQYLVPLSREQLSFMARYGVNHIQIRLKLRLRVEYLSAIFASNARSPARKTVLY
jgi:hypothetical protein